jgi:hypothetical protein
MEIKTTIKYYIEVLDHPKYEGPQTLYFKSFEEADKKLKSFRKSEMDCHIYKEIIEGKSIKEIYLVD